MRFCFLSLHILLTLSDPRSQVPFQKTTICDVCLLRANGDVARILFWCNMILLVYSCGWSLEDLPGHAFSGLTTLCAWSKMPCQRWLLPVVPLSAHNNPRLFSRWSWCRVTSEIMVGVFATVVVALVSQLSRCLCRACFYFVSLAITSRSSSKGLSTTGCHDALSGSFRFP